MLQTAAVLPGLPEHPEGDLILMVKSEPTTKSAVIRLILSASARGGIAERDRLSEAKGRSRSRCGILCLGDRMFIKADVNPSVGQPGKILQGS
jgi:hypothetical protein